MPVSIHTCVYACVSMWLKYILLRNIIGEFLSLNYKCFSYMRYSDSFFSVIDCYLSEHNSYITMHSCMHIVSEFT